MLHRQRRAGVGAETTAESRALVPVVPAVPVVYAEVIDAGDGRAVALGDPEPRWESASASWLKNYVAPRTKKAYERDLRAFILWCASRGVRSFRQVTRDHVNDYRDALIAAGKSPTTVARTLSCLRQFFATMQSDGLVNVNPAARVKGEKVSTESPRHALTNAHARLLLAAPDRSTLKGARDYAILCLLLYLAMRRAEAAALRTDMFGEQEGHQVVRFTAKGHKARVLPLPSHVYAAIRDYLVKDGRGDALDAGQPARPLFRPIRNPKYHELERSITPEAIWYLVRDYTRAANLRRHVSPHELRHSAVSNAIDGNVPLQRVQELAGHADIRTTMRYKTTKDSIRLSAALRVDYDRQETTAAETEAETA